MKRRFLLMSLLFVGLIALVGLVLMLLWNWLMPELFQLPAINYYQALGLLLLSKILFGGFRGKKSYGCHHHESHYGWKEKFKAKWQNMPADDRKKWEEKFGSCWKERSESGN